MPCFNPVTIEQDDFHQSLDQLASPVPLPAAIRKEPASLFQTSPLRSLASDVLTLKAPRW